MYIELFTGICGLSSENRVPPAVIFSVKKALGSRKTLREYWLFFKRIIFLSFLIVNSLIYINYFSVIKVYSVFKA